MSRRRELKSIASGIAGYCVSRNNDIDGYWAIGVIYNIAIARGSYLVPINISSNAPICPELSAFRKLFRDRFELIGNPLYHFIKGFIVEFQFTPYAVSKSRGQQACATCTVHIIDDLNKRRSASATTFSYPHNCQFELKSTRG
ncbi:MAG: hypothetical protein L3J39_08015 [Verrucomicrobiales bacterium]|nr:hypothetical protein [Verrucomicrobiales bacterium]